MIEAAGALIGKLHQDDFETLVDLILNRSGWHRISALGGTQKDADMILERAITGETAFVQVKSQASQIVLDRYIRIFDGYDNVLDANANGEGASEAIPAKGAARTGRTTLAASDAGAGHLFHAGPPTARNTCMIFACHEARSSLHAYGRNDIYIWDLPFLANSAIRNGLFDWIIERTG